MSVDIDSNSIFQLGETRVLEVGVPAAEFQEKSDIVKYRGAQMFHSQYPAIVGPALECGQILLAKGPVCFAGQCM